MAYDRTTYLLQKRASAMCQRCTNPNDRSWHNYGARGIEFRFGSIKECVEYILKELPAATYVGLDIDREDSNGHYEPGNLRLVSRTHNLRNKRRNARMMWQRERILVVDWKENPYDTVVARRFAAAGMSGEEIIDKAWQAVHEKRKNWRHIQEKLLFMTSSTAAHEIGSSPTG